MNDYSFTPPVGREGFKFPPIQVDATVHFGTAYVIAPRKPGETEEEWGRRCSIITNIGEPE